MKQPSLPCTTLHSWVTDDFTGSRGVVRKQAIGDKCIPIEPGFERVEVMVLEPQGHHRKWDIVIWDVKAIPGGHKSKVWEALM